MPRMTKRRYGKVSSTENSTNSGEESGDNWAVNQSKLNYYADFARKASGETREARMFVTTSSWRPQHKQTFSFLWRGSFRHVQRVFILSEITNRIFKQESLRWHTITSSINWWCNPQMVQMMMMMSVVLRPPRVIMCSWSLHHQEESHSAISVDHTGLMFHRTKGYPECIECVGA
ncbi:hypothetical protein RRG08_014396 [Elysia crispata]|uniref:Uncharacterized protein n=1 Tax=Elysia crispata TaxID=231223 RepID=A0AAE0YVV2_9GAST|nr:hypothetical protein RRG08_014396 [Elysia crispata]